MRWLLCCGLSLALWLPVGCATAPGRAKPPAGGASAASPPKELMVADSSLIGRVVSFNPAARYAILQFPLGLMAANGQQMFVYREGQRVGELKISGPSRDDRTAADLQDGNCQTGDEVRDR